MARRRRRLLLPLLSLVWVHSAHAHRPYEHPERVVTDTDGRSHQLVKSYVDGIIFSDPVKLVVLDADDDTVLETEYGKDVSVVCWGSQPCVVYRYDGVAPLLPTNVWRLEGGALHDARSVGLLTLGVVAPLWDHAGGYLFALLSLAIPLLVLWRVWRLPGSRGRTLLLTLGVLAAVPYSGVWLYAVTLLSYLSLPLVVLVCAGGVAALFLARTAALRAGVDESTLLKLARAGGTASATLAGVAAVTLMVSVVRMESHSRGIVFDEPPVRPPLAKARITRAKGKTQDVFVTLADGVKVADVVDLDLFAGFDAAMTRAEAARRLGPPSGRWTDPAYRVQASYYQRPGGRVSLVRQGASPWSTIGYPSTCSPASVFRDGGSREQILSWLPAQDMAQVNVLRRVGSGGVTVFGSRTSCTHLVLTARDAEAPAVREEVP